MPRDIFSEFDDLAGPEDHFQGVVEPSADPVAPGVAMVPQSTLDAVTERLNDTVQVRDTAIRGALAQPAGDTPPAVVPGEEIDPEILASVTPIMKQLKAEIMEAVAPALHNADRRANLDVLNDRIDGFEETLMGEVEKVYNALSPELQQEYGTRVGMEALALKIQQKKAAENPAAPAYDRSGMAATAPSGGAGGQPRQMTEDDIFNLPQSDFDKMLGQVQNTRRG